MAQSSSELAGRSHMAGCGRVILIHQNSTCLRQAELFQIADTRPNQALEVLPAVKKVTVLAGVCGTNLFREMPASPPPPPEMERIGFVGVQNLNTVGLIDGQFRRNFEETGKDLIAEAHKQGLVTSYVFDTGDATKMAKAGAAAVVAHAGLATSGSTGALGGRPLEQSMKFVQEIRDAAGQVDHILVLCNGGPIALPSDAGSVFSRMVGGVVFRGEYGAVTGRGCQVVRRMRSNLSD
ncbi:hypothetical protein N7520_000674 [Penicillium odoratum]|uniref:uncharacterized protein n=1 Tax=Penicillium odoratum TaxID=1167516 RepID=UPI00254921C3|nr:uncharacterized protein N7520_000674 [Penicillium odoratum]KAJ5777428.1 hypothetical protein N7520_000674 [Penicillium odoratum]